MDNKYHLIDIYYPESTKYVSSTDNLYHFPLNFVMSSYLLQDMWDGGLPLGRIFRESLFVLLVIGEDSWDQVEGGPEYKTSGGGGSSGVGSASGSW